MKWAIAAATVAAGLVLPGCHVRAWQVLLPGEKGDGVIVTEAREVGPFSAIAVGDALELTYKPADAVRVAVEGDSNLVPQVRTEIRDGRLVAAMTPNHSISPTRPLRVLVEGPCPQAFDASGASRLEAALPEGGSPRSVSASGAAHVALTGVAVEALRLEASGASHLAVSGRVDSLDLEAAGASRVDASGLDAAIARVDVAGASNATVRARDRVEGEASGASHVRVVGRPAAQRVATSGASGVEQVALDAP